MGEVAPSDMGQERFSHDLVSADFIKPRRDPGPSYGGVGLSYGGVWGLKSLGFEGPRAVWSVWEDVRR